MAAELNEMVHKQLLDKINQGNLDEVRKILETGQIAVDSLDEDGMTPLMQAAYKGKADICELLLSKGADVNSNQHEHKYTPLMFACLSGSTEATRILLEAGADTQVTNTIGRTASQLAAFTGRHDCVSLLSNFISIKDFEQFTKVKGSETSPKLDPKHLVALHRYTLMSNLSPVKLVLYLKENIGLVEDYTSVVNVLKLKMSSCAKDPRYVKEVMVIKLHYIASVLWHCGRWHKGLQGQNGVDGFLKNLIKGRPSDGFPIATEELIRKIILEFSFTEMPIFKQLVTSIAPVTKGNDPTALTCLNQAINGLQSVEYENRCATCSQNKAEKKCSACKQVTYCGATCQKLHWFTHKKRCKPKDSTAEKTESA